MNNPTMLFIGITIFVLCLWAAYHVLRFMFKDHKLAADKIGGTQPHKGMQLPPWRIHNQKIVKGHGRGSTRVHRDTYSDRCKAGRGY